MMKDGNTLGQIINIFTLRSTFDHKSFVRFPSYDVNHHKDDYHYIFSRGFLSTFAFHCCSEGEHLRRHTGFPCKTSDAPPKNKKLCWQQGAILQNAFAGSFVHNLPSSLDMFGDVLAFEAVLRFLNDQSSMSFGTLEWGPRINHSALYKKKLKCIYKYANIYIYIFINVYVYIYIM